MDIIKKKILQNNKFRYLIVLLQLSPIIYESISNLFERNIWHRNKHEANEPGCSPEKPFPGKSKLTWLY